MAGTGFRYSANNLTHYETLRGYAETLTTDQRVGGSNPSGRAIKVKLFPIFSHELTVIRVYLGSRTSKSPQHRYERQSARSASASLLVVSTSMNYASPRRQALQASRFAVLQSPVPDYPPSPPAQAARRLFGISPRSLSLACAHSCCCRRLRAYWKAAFAIEQLVYRLTADVDYSSALMFGRYRPKVLWSR
jgi:hypothetical protein